MDKEIEKLKHSNRQLKRKLNRLESEVLTREIFLDRMLGELSLVKPVIPYKPKKYPNEFTEQEAVLLFSDCQIGEKTDFWENQLGSYNLNIFKKRLKYLAEKVVLITDMHRKSVPIYDLNIFMLGDMVEGEQIFKGQGCRLEDNVARMFFEGEAEISEFLKFMAKNYREVKIKAIAGNHGRINPPSESRFIVNWDFIMYKFLERGLSQQKNIKFEIPESWWMVSKVKGHEFYLDHGNNLGVRYMGIPWYGIEKADGRTVKLLQQRGIKYEYMVFGHHHTPFEWDASYGERICNGTFSSHNFYAAKKLQLDCRPTQKFFGVHKERGITFRYNIRMDEVK